MPPAALLGFHQPIGFTDLIENAKRHVIVISDED
jgi:hypothetical protein